MLCISYFLTVGNLHNEDGRGGGSWDGGKGGGGGVTMKSNNEKVEKTYRLSQGEFLTRQSSATCMSLT